MQSDSAWTRGAARLLLYIACLGKFGGVCGWGWGSAPAAASDETCDAAGNCDGVKIDPKVLLRKFPKLAEDALSGAKDDPRGALDKLREATRMARQLQKIAPELHGAGADKEESTLQQHYFALMNQASIVQMVGRKEELAKRSGEVLADAEQEALDCMLEALALDRTRSLMDASRFVTPCIVLLRHKDRHYESEEIFKAATELHKQRRIKYKWAHADQLPSKEVNPKLFTKKPEVWFDASKHAVGRFMAKNADLIMKEAEAIPNSKGFQEFEGQIASTTGGASEASWTEMILFDRPTSGWQNKGCKLMPKTCQAFRKAKFPEIEGGPSIQVKEFGQCCRVSVLRLRPQSHVAPHCGNSNQRLVLHLGLRVPEPDKVAVRAGNVTTTWLPGKVIMFDDSYFHEVWNNGTKERWVLYVSVTHPKLKPFIPPGF